MSEEPQATDGPATADASTSDTANPAGEAATNDGKGEQSAAPKVRLPPGAYFFSTGGELQRLAPGTYEVSHVKVLSSLLRQRQGGGRLRRASCRDGAAAPTAYVGQRSAPWGTWRGGREPRPA